VTLSQTRPLVGRCNPGDAVEFLLRDPAWNAYGLGYLEPGAARAIQLWSAQREGQIVSLVVRAELAQLTSLFATGDAEGLGEVIPQLSDLPPSGVFSARPEGLERLQQHVLVGTSYRMSRMRVGRSDFRPRRTAETRRLGVADLEAVRAVYGMWTDSHQLPGQLERGVYYGVFAQSAGRRQLIAVAGTHCIAARHGIAAIGNVLTHSSYRNRGLASTTTTAVAEELFEMGCEELVLNVRQGNDAAHTTYRHLGFREHCTFVEGVFQGRHH
jgi:ribosomal protein S18 acetylase RimI-like enzyme